MGRTLLLLALLGTILAGCGSVDWFPTTGPNSAASVVVTASPTSPIVGSSVTITATVKKADGTAVPDGTAVSFTTAGGTLSGFSATTSGGIATVTLTNTSASSCTVTASTGIVSGNVTVTFVSGITVAASPSAATVGTLVNITANVNKADGTPVDDGTTVTFAAPNGGGFLGGFSTMTATTTIGVATVKFSSSFQGSFTVTATVGTDTASTIVTFI